MVDREPTDEISEYIHSRSRIEVSDDLIQKRLRQFDRLSLRWQYRNVPELLFDFVAYARNQVENGS